MKKVEFDFSTFFLKKEFSESSQKNYESGGVFEKSFRKAHFYKIPHVFAVSLILAVFFLFTGLFRPLSHSSPTGERDKGIEGLYSRETVQPCNSISNDETSILRITKLLESPYWMAWQRGGQAAEIHDGGKS